MKRRTMLLAPLAIAVATAIPPPPAHALQDLTIGARTGTLGHGAELVLITNKVFSLRAGAGLVGFDADITNVSGLADNRTGTLAVPRSVYTLGADLAVGNFRIGGGVLYKKRDPVYAITYADGAEIDIGSSTYTAPEVTRLSTTLFSESWAPYVLLGLGQHVGRGVGLFLDAGVAFLDEPGLAMSATGDGRVLASRRFRRDLRAEEDEMRSDVGDLVKYWPILSVGVQFGFGEGRRRGGRW
ncbi:MAG: hypothetical protein F4107_13020 [Gemmatimonadetes bacterium]|nr:hypothetical protein [Gemmatimonadota bacterium]MXX35264.1 hypothetical protein [Gemmatimonadota bacterium]MYD14355.1 hypothetical protein [Gemmatimonadota bacterium]MYI66836.1 hypothetical protein [Gemmatimonadota bacterium]